MEVLYLDKKSIFNRISPQTNIEKIYLYSKDPYKVKYHLLINAGENIDLMHVNNQKAFIEYSNCMDDIYKNIKQYILNK